TQLGRFEEAERYVRLALEQSATSDATLYNYGIILKALKRPAEALERFNQALAINASVAETWNNRGTVLNELERYQEAISDFDKATSLSPKNWQRGVLQGRHAWLWLGDRRRLQQPHRRCPAHHGLRLQRSLRSLLDQAVQVVALRRMG